MNHPAARIGFILATEGDRIGGGAQIRQSWCESNIVRYQQRLAAANIENKTLMATAFIISISTLLTRLLPQTALPPCFSAITAYSAALSLVVAAGAVISCCGSSGLRYGQTERR